MAACGFQEGFRAKLGVNRFHFRSLIILTLSTYLPSELISTEE